MYTCTEMYTMYMAGGPLLMRDEETREYVLIGILRGAGGPRCNPTDDEIFGGLTQTDWSKVTVFADWIKGLIDQGEWI